MPHNPILSWTLASVRAELSGGFERMSRCECAGKFWSLSALTCYDHGGTFYSLGSSPAKKVPILSPFKGGHLHDSMTQGVPCQGSFQHAWSPLPRKVPRDCDPPSLPLSRAEHRLGLCVRSAPWWLLWNTARPGPSLGAGVGRARRNWGKQLSLLWEGWVEVRLL